MSISLPVSGVPIFKDTVGYFVVLEQVLNTFVSSNPGKSMKPFKLTDAWSQLFGEQDRTARQVLPRAQGQCLVGSPGNGFGL
jgi:hypothetical protein